MGPADIKAFREGCEVPDCEGKHSGHGYCDTHLRRYQKHGDPLVTIHQRDRALPRGGSHPQWAGPDVTYSGMHQRITRTRGRASAHQCAMNCGRQAAQWSIVRVDGSPMPFSTDPADYRPLCVPCHKKYDMAALINEGWPHRRAVP